MAQSVHGPYELKLKDGRTITVWVYVDSAAIAKNLAVKAFRAPSGIAKTCGDAVMVQTTPYISSKPKR